MAFIYRVRTIISGPTGSPWLSTQFFSSTAANHSSAEATAAQLKVRNAWVGWASAVANDATAVVQSDVDVLDPADGELLASYSPGAFTQAGGATAEPLPWATQGALRISTPTIVEGRKLRGKIFLPAPTEANNDIGTPNAAYIADVDAGSAALLALPADPYLAVWHRPVVNDQGVVTRPGSQHVATAVTTLGYWAILRSRRD